MKKLLYTFSLMLLTIGLFGQSSVTGMVIDSETGEGLIGATVFVKGSEKGTVTSIDGSFELGNLKPGTYTLTFNYVGYVSKEMEVELAEGENSIGDINLSPDAIGLEEINVIASVAQNRKTPVASSKIQGEVIVEKLGNQEFVEIMRSTPSVYTTKTSGGFGDSRINIRGFAQEDLAVLINGIPVNGMEDNKVYWSNWAGLGDVTRTIDIQRGLGASRLAVASVGGTINIITKTTDVEKGGSIYTGIGNDGYRKTAATLSTGRLDNGWAITASGARTTGDGYVEGNYIDAWTYFFSVAKEIGDDHMLMLTGFGAPQKHGQRSFEHPLNGLKNTYGIRWNDDYGYYRNNDFTWRDNFYHKPQVALNHFWEINDKSTLSTAVYGSIGRGGGTGDIGDAREFRIPNDEQGHENFDAIARWNKGQDSLLIGSSYEDQIGALDYQFADGQSGTGQIISQNAGIIKRASMNEHQWYGVLSTYNNQLTSNLNFNAGLDLRWYTGSHYRKTIDLLGGDYWFDTDNINQRGDWVDFNNDGVRDAGEMGNLVRPLNSADRLFGNVDDDQKIDYHNDENINWYGAFGQLEYNSGNISAFLSGAVNMTSMRRIDFFQKTPGNQTTDWTNFIGGNVKTGLNYNINNRNNVYANVGFISRAPYFDALYPTFNNDERNEDAVNEKVYSAELGYGFRSKNFRLNINGYYTYWQDKTTVLNFRDAENQNYFLNLLSVNAVHTGFEAEVKAPLSRNFGLFGFASIGNWQWANNPDGVVVDDQQQVVDEVKLFIDGLKVGDAAQTSFGIGADYIIGAGIKLDAQVTHFRALYANYVPNDRSNDALSGIQPLELPAFTLTDVGISWRFDISGLDAEIRANINNLFDNIYVSEAFDTVRFRDGEVQGDAQIGDDNYDEVLLGTQGWYGFGRTWNIGAKVRF